MKIKNASPLGALSVPALGGVVVEAGSVVDVPESIAAPLLQQVGVWEPADAAAKKLTPPPALGPVDDGLPDPVTPTPSITPEEG